MSTSTKQQQKQQIVFVIFSMSHKEQICRKIVKYTRTTCRLNFLVNMYKADGRPIQLSKHLLERF